MLKRSVVALCVAASVAGCGRDQSLPANEAYEYTLSEDGPADTRDRQTYESLGDVTFTRNQKYKLVGQTEASRMPHFVVLSITKRIGKKVISRNSTSPVFMNDGTYNLECSHYYDVKISKGEDSVDDPQCTVKLLGVLKSDAPAKLRPS